MGDLYCNNYVTAVWDQHYVIKTTFSFKVFKVFGWLYVLIMSRTRFRMYPHSTDAWMFRNSLLKTSDCNGTRTHDHIVRKRILNQLARLTKWLSCVVSTICMVHLIECSYRVMNAFQSESTPHSCLNVKELLAPNRCDIWSFWILSNCNGTRTHNHLARKRTLSCPIDWAVLWV